MNRALLIAAAAASSLSLAACEKKPEAPAAAAPEAPVAAAPAAPVASEIAAAPAASEASSDNWHTVVSPIEVVAGATPAGPPSTETLIMGVTLTDMYQVQAGKIAQAKGQSPGVKDFGKLMVTDHTAMSDQMKHLFVATKEKIPTELGPRGKRMIAALNAAGPADFDKLYLDQQEAAQKAELSLLQDYAGAGESADIKPAAANAVPKVQGHLAKIKELQAAHP
jgi:putative membrane protein